MGGAAQAAADLAAARKQIDPAKVAGVQELLKIGDKLVKGMRMFAAGHKTLVGFQEELHAKAGLYLAAHGELTLTIEPDGVLVDGALVFACEKIDDNYLFPLYQDGVRQLVLRPGLAGEEGVALFDVLDLARSTPAGAGEDDTVTHLWSRKLAHVGVVVVDEEAEEDEEEGEDGETSQRSLDLKVILDFAARREIDLPDPARPFTGAHLPAIAAENLGSLAELPTYGELHADALALRPEEAAQLAHAAAAGAHALETYLAALLWALFEGHEAADQEVIVQLVGQLVSGLIARKELARAARACRAVGDRSAAALRVPAAAAVAGRLGAALASEAVVGPVVEAIVTGDDALREEALALAACLPGAAAPRLIGRLPQIKDRRDRRKLCDALGRMGDEALQLASQAVFGAPEEVALDLLQLLHAGGGARTALLIEPATRHRAAHVRFEALGLYLKAADPETSRRRATALLDDKEGAVRRLVLDHLVALRAEASAEQVQKLCEADSFAARELAEKKRLYLGLAALRGPAALPWLRERLSRRNLLGSGSVDEERAAAAAALGFLRDEESRSALEKLAGAMMTRAVVKTECEAALAALGAPEEER